MSETDEITQEADAKAAMDAAMKVFNDLGQRDAFPNNRFRKHTGDENFTMGYSFDFGNPWYTGRTVSSIAELGVVINGFVVDPRHIFIIVRDQKIPGIVAKTMHELWWGFGEVAQIFIEKEGLEGTILKKSNNIEVKLGMNSPSGQLVNFALHGEMEVN